MSAGNAEPTTRKNLKMFAPVASFFHARPSTRGLAFLSEREQSAADCEILSAAKKESGLKWIDKPDSVMARSTCDSDHSSSPLIAQGVKRPYPRAMGGPPNPPIWPCSRWGLPCARHHWRTGELLPRLFNLTGRKSSRRCVFCGTFPRLRGAAVSGHPVLWSPDFPPSVQVHGKRSLDPL